MLVAMMALYLSTDKGNSWSRLGQKELSSEFIHDLVFDKSNNLWIATYKEAACYNPQSDTWQIINVGLPGGSINCLGVTEDDEILAGTNYGLYKLTSKEAAPMLNRLSTPNLCSRKNHYIKHFSGRFRRMNKTAKIKPISTAQLWEAISVSTRVMNTTIPKAYQLWQSMTALLYLLIHRSAMRF